MNTESASISRKRRITGSVLMSLGGLVLLASATTKLAQIPKVMAELGAMGVHGNNVTLIAMLEVISALLFLLPATRSVGLLLVSSFLGGAIATHLEHGQPVIQPAVVLLLIWLGTWLRHPDILWSLRRPAVSANQVAHQERRETARAPGLREVVKSAAK